MFRLVTAPISVRLLSNIVTKPKPYFLNVRWSNSSSNITKNYENTFAVTLDTDGDGFISRKEFLDDLSQRFAATVGAPQENVDQLHSLLSKLAKSMGITDDRQISCNEFTASARAALQNPEFGKLFTDVYNCFFDGLDSNGDGYISPTEWVKLMKFMNFDPKDADAAFKAIDKNGDGLISRDEYCSLHLEYWTSDEQPILGSDKMYGDREPLDPPGRN